MVGRQYTVGPLHSPSKARSALHADVLVQVLDPTLCLQQELGLESGDWILIEHDGRKAAAQVILAPEAGGDQSLLASPLLLFFLRDIPANPFLDRHAPIEVSISRFDDSHSPYQIPVPAAQNVILKPLASNHSQPSREAMQAFFRIPHVFTSGMIIGIPLDENSPLLYNDLHLGGIPSHPAPFDSLPNISISNSIALAFYQISCPEQSIFAVDESTTCVKTEHSVIHSFAPFEMSQYMSRLNPIRDLFVSQRHFDMLIGTIRPFFHPLANQLGLSPNLLIFGKRRSGKRLLASMAAQALGVNYVEVNCYDLLQPIERQTALHLQKFISTSASTNPVIIHLRRLSALWEQSMAHGRSDCCFLSSVLHQELVSCSKMPNVVIIGSCEGPRRAIPTSMSSSFCYEMTLDALDAQERTALIMHYLPECSDLANEASSASAGANNGDILDLCAQIELNCLVRSNSKTNSGDEFQQLYGEFSQFHELLYRSSPDPSDLSTAIASYHKRLASSEGTAATSSGIPNVKWEDIGGLSDVKEAILDIIDLPYRHPELFQNGVRRKCGVLLYGPPGTGKTLLAKAIATEFCLNFISIKGPELLNMYVGESEANIRTVFDRARASRPCIMFFDELDSLAPNRGQGSDSGGVMDRVVSQLLTELDGMDKANDIFVIGATNRPDLIDSALLRPGRLDTCIYLGTCLDKESQLKVLQALTRKFNLAADVCLKSVADACPLTFTGADFYALCSDAMLNAIKSSIKLVDEQLRKTFGEAVQNKQIRTALRSIAPHQFQVCVSQDDFLRALDFLTPSLTESELHRYEMLRKQFEESRSS